MPDEWIPMSEAAARLGISTATLRRRIDLGEFTAERVGRGTRAPLYVSRSEVDALTSIRPFASGIDATGIRTGIDSLGVIDGLAESARKAMDGPFKIDTSALQRAMEAAGKVDRPALRASKKLIEDMKTAEPPTALEELRAIAGSGDSPGITETPTPGGATAGGNAPSASTSIGTSSAVRPEIAAIRRELDRHMDALLAALPALLAAKAVEGIGDLDDDETLDGQAIHLSVRLQRAEHILREAEKQVRFAAR